MTSSPPTGVPVWHRDPPADFEGARCPRGCGKFLRGGSGAAADHEDCYDDHSAKSCVNWFLEVLTLRGPPYSPKYEPVCCCCCCCCCEPIGAHGKRG